MNSHSLVSRSCLLLVFLMSSGCNSVYRASLRRAEEAAERGDFIAAAQAYRSACRAAPGDETACGQAPIFTQKAVAQAIEHARPACEAGELDHCLAPLLEAQELAPNHPEITTLIDTAGDLHAKRCAMWNTDGSLNKAVAGLACLQARAHQFPSPRYQSLIAESANQLASRFIEHAAIAEEQAESGAAAVFWSTAQCLSPSKDNTWRAQQASKDFLDSSGIPVRIYLGGFIPLAISKPITNLCPYLSSELPAWAQCTTDGAEVGQGEPLHLQIDAVIQALKEKVERRKESKEYVIDTQEKKNPEYERAQERLQSAEAALQQAEQQRQQAQKQPAAECSERKALSLVRCKGCPVLPEAKIPCAPDAAENYKRKLAERDKARQQLSTLPEKVKEEIKEQISYTVSSYTWTSDFRFTIKTNTPGTRTTPFQQSGVLTFKDTQHRRDDRIALEEDPLDYPPDETIAEAFLKNLTPHVIAAVKQDGKTRSSTRRGQCKKLTADWSSSWVQCWAEATFWESGKQPPSDSFLQLLASSAGISHQVKCR